MVCYIFYIHVLVYIYSTYTSITGKYVELSYKLTKLKEILRYAMTENIKLQYDTKQKMKFFIKDFFSKCDQTRNFEFFVLCEILDCR